MLDENIFASCKCTRMDGAGESIGSGIGMQLHTPEIRSKSALHGFADAIGKRLTAASRSLDGGFDGRIDLGTVLGRDALDSRHKLQSLMLVFG